MTTQTVEVSATYQTQGVANDVKFLQELGAAFGDQDFRARIYPAGDGSIRTARVNTGDDIEGPALDKLIKQAAKWELDLTIGRSGAGIRILFEKE